jgi:hypothetical protein
MRLTAKEYRDQLYRLRSHPHRERTGFKDARDSFGVVYASILPFIGMEYYTEISYEFLASGLVFPIGFLLFWAFYYTFYRPGFLENRLANPAQWDFFAVPAVLLGVLIWFVKVTIVELGGLASVKMKSADTSRPQGIPFSKAAGGWNASQKKAEERPSRQSSAPPALLSPDLIEALQTLGLKPGCNWHDIHRQYRHLAKQFHPDLNQDITDFGNRFMKVDSAYHRLAKVREKHFPGK